MLIYKNNISIMIKNIGALNMEQKLMKCEMK